MSLRFKNGGRLLLLQIEIFYFFKSGFVQLLFQCLLLHFGKLRNYRNYLENEIQTVSIEKMWPW